MKKSLLICIALLVVTLTSFGTPTIWYVDPSGTNDGSHGTAIGSGAFLTIQYAINAASSGDEIDVAAGTYVEDIVVNKQLTILGPNASIDPNTGTRAGEAILMPATNNVSTYGVLMNIQQSSGIIIKGFTFDGDNPSINGGTLINGADINTSVGILNGNNGNNAGSGNSSNQIDHVTIQNNIFKNFTLQGVYLDNNYNSPTTQSSFNYITHNKFDNMKEAIQIYATYAEMSYNVISNVNRGLSMHSTRFAAATGFVPTVSNNNISISDYWTATSRYVGIWINFRSGGAPVLTLSNNTVNYNGSFSSGTTMGFYALSVKDTRTVTFSNNTVNGGNVCDIGLYATGCESPNVSITNSNLYNIRGEGIYAKNYDEIWGGQITDVVNISADNVNMTLTSSGIGALVNVLSGHNTTASITLTNSTISGGTDGVKLQEGVSGKASATVNNNSITGQSGFAINATTIANTVAATCNWYGTTSGVAAKINGNVTFVPYNVSNGGACVGGMPVVVKHSGTITGGYSTIQAGINAAASGDEVDVAAGTYHEFINITKSLTLNGAKAGIDARTRTFTGESVLDGTGFTGSPYDAIKIANGVSNVVIDGFEITNYPGSGSNGDGNAISSYCMNANTTGASNVTIQNNYLHGLAYNGILVGSENDNGTTMVTQTGWLIQKNKVAGFTYGGIELTNVTNSQVKDNDISAPTSLFDDPGDAGVGIEIAARSRSKAVTAGTSNEVSGNTITGTFPTASRTAINLLARAYTSASNATLSTVTVNNNTITGATHVQAAILAVAESRNNAPATISTLGITNNTLDGNLDGIDIRDYLNGGSGTPSHSSVSITGNDIKNSTGIGLHIITSTSASGITVSSNKFVSNAVYGIKNEGSGSLSATCNWWGSANSATVASKVNGSVNYTPWLLNGTDDDGGTPGFQPASGTCSGTPITITSTTPAHITCGLSSGSIQVAFSGGSSAYAFAWTGGSASGVTGSPYSITGLAAGAYNVTITDVNGSMVTTSATILTLPVTNTSNSTYYATIQEAIDAASSGNVITVCAGTYAESLSIGKSLTLLGPNATQTPNSGSRASEAILAPTTDADAILASAGGITVIIKGFKVDMTNALANSQVFFSSTSNSTWTFEHNIYTGFHGADYAAWWITGDFTDFSFNLWDNRFTANSSASNGVMMDYPTNTPIISILDNVWIDNGGWGLNLNSVHGTIAGNIFKNSVYPGDIGLNGQGGILFAASNNDVTLENNTFELLNRSILLWPDAGAANFGGTLNVHNNLFKDIPNNGGRSAFYAPAGTSVSGVTLSHNSFVNNYFNVKNLTATALNATCNWWGSTSNAAIAAKFTGTGAITYSLWLVDGANEASGPGFSQSTYVCSGSPVIITSTTPGHITCGLTTGSIQVAFSGGTSTYSFAWTGGSASGISGSPYSITGLAAGAYNVTITDANGSTATTSATILSQPVHNYTSGAYYTTIQAAINAASVGDQIDICAGTFNENLTVDKRITLNGAGIASTTINSTASSTPVISVTGSGTDATHRIVISNLKVTGASGADGIRVVSSSSQGYLTFSYVNASSNTNGNGIHFGGTGAVTDAIVSHCTMNSNGMAGIRIATACPSFDGLLVDYCTVNSNGLSGFSYNPSANLSNVGTNFTISNSSFANNITAASANNHDLSFYGFHGNATLTNVSIESGNGTSANGANYALLFTNASTFAAAGNITLYGVTITGYAGKGALSFQKYSSTSNVSLTDVDVSGCSAAWGQVIIDQSGTGTLSLGNTTFKTLVLWNTGNVDATISIIKNTTSGGALSRSSLSDCFKIEDQVVHKVDLATLGLVTWKTGELFVTTNSYVTPNTNPSIQRGIDAASTGNTVNVAAGTYDEQLNVNKAIKLYGAQHDVTPVAGGRSGGETIIHGGNVTGGPGGLNFIWNEIDINSDNVEVNGFECYTTHYGITTDNGAVGTHSGVKIKYNYVHPNTYSDDNYVGIVTAINVSGYTPPTPAPTFNNYEISHNLVVASIGPKAIAPSGASTYNDLNISYNDISCPNGSGIFAGGSPGLTKFNNTVITYNNIHNIHGTGINIANLVSATIDHNTFSNPGGDAAFVNMNGGSFSNNTISNIQTTEGWGLELYGSGDYGITTTTECKNVTIANNSFTYNDYNTATATVALWLDAHALASTMSVNNNSFIDGAANSSTGCYAIYNQASTTLSSTCNWFGTAIGNNIAPKISGNVTYASWLTSGGNSATIGFTPTGTCNGSAIVLSSTHVNVLCYGNNTGSIDLTASGGAGTLTYDWSNSLHTQDLSNLAAGTYYVTVTDANGTFATTSVVITQPSAALSVAKDNQTNISCYGQLTGAINVTVSGGTTAYTYAWTKDGSSYATTEDLATLAPGVYNLTVTDAHSCTAVLSPAVTITQPNISNGWVRNMTKSGQPYYCTIQSAIDDATANDEIRVGAGTYNESVSITKSLTLRGAQFSVHANTGARTNPALESIINGTSPVAIMADNVVVDGLTIQGSDNTGFISGIWFNPGYSGSHGGFQILNNIIQNNVNGIDVGNDGTIQAFIKFNLIKNNNNPGAGSGNGLGTDFGLKNTVIDQNTFDNNQVNLNGAGTSGVQSITFSNNEIKSVIYSGLFLQSTSGITVTGNNIHNNAEGISVAGGDADLTISNNALINNTGLGIKVSDPYTVGSNSNVAVYSNNISNNTLGGVTLVSGTYTGTLDATYNYWSSCPSASGSVTFFPYYTTIANSPGTYTFSGLTANITAGATLPTVCAGSATTIYASGGSDYVWSNSLGLGSSKVVSPTTSTTYTVTGKDSHGCTDAFASVAVTVNSAPTVMINGLVGGSGSVALGSSITLTASGGTTYVWNTGSTANPITVSPTANTTYSVVGTTAGGCTGSTTFSITVASVSAGANRFICYGNSTLITATVAGVTANSWAWSSGGATQSINASPLLTTQYTVTVNGDPALHASVTIYVNPKPIANPGPNITIAPAGTGTLLGSASAGTAPYAYSWTTTGGSIIGNPNTPTPTVAAAGSYAILVTDAYGCSSNPSAAVVNVASSGFTVSGNVSYYLGTVNPQMHNVTVTLAGGATYTTTTPATGNGDYQFLGIPAGTYQVKLSSSKPWGGVTSADIVAIQNHYKSPPTLLKGIEHIAADVVSAGTGAVVTSADRDLVNSRRLNPAVAFTETGDWVFTRSGDAAGDPISGPFFYANSAGFSNIILEVTTGPVSQNFKALCYGDVDASYTGVKDNENSIVNFNTTNGLDLSNFPNPFAGTTSIRFTVPVAGKVTVQVHTLLGEPVGTLNDPDDYEGVHTLTFNGQGLAPGVYLYTVRLKTTDDTFVQTGKMVIVK